MTLTTDEFIWRKLYSFSTISTVKVLLLGFTIEGRSKYICSHSVNTISNGNSFLKCILLDSFILYKNNYDILIKYPCLQSKFWFLYSLEY